MRKNSALMAIETSISMDDCKQYTFCIIEMQTEMKWSVRIETPFLFYNVCSIWLVRHVAHTLMHHNVH